MGTINVLEAVRRTPSLRVCVVVTTDKCYENREWVYGYREDDPMGGHDPYSASKGATERAVASWRRSFFADADASRIATARAGNVIGGGGDWAEDRLVVDLVKAMANGADLRVRNPRATRPWQHVLEPLSGYLTLATHLLSDDGRDYQSGWNFGRGIMVYIPRGFARGLLSLKKQTTLQYQVETPYVATSDRGIHWDSCGVTWPDLGEPPTVSLRDADFPPAFGELESPF